MTMNAMARRRSQLRAEGDAGELDDEGQAH
jgi:hypothetical protein